MWARCWSFDQGHALEVMGSKCWLEIITSIFTNFSETQERSNWCNWKSHQNQRCADEEEPWHCPQAPFQISISFSIQLMNNLCNKQYVFITGGITTICISILNISDSVKICWKYFSFNNGLHDTDKFAHLLDHFIHFSPFSNSNL